MLEPGIKGHCEITVQEENTAEHMGSGTLQVFATPSMIALIEETAWKSVAEELESGCASVGTSLDIRHLSATPVGMRVFCDTELIEVDNRRLVFSAVVFDEAGKVGEGTHERFVILSEKFQSRADGKKLL